MAGHVGACWRASRGGCAASRCVGLSRPLGAFAWRRSGGARWTLLYFFERLSMSSVPVPIALNLWLVSI